MKIKHILSVAVIYFLVLFQNSFLAHFSFLGITVNIVFIGLVIWNIFEDAKNRFGIYLAVIGGFFLDIFSPSFIGWNILILVLIALILKIIFSKYVRLPFKKV